MSDRRVFFVPFNTSQGPSRLIYTRGPISPAGSPDPETMPVVYTSLTIQTSPTTTYTIKRDDDVMLRPPSNAEAPRIGRVTAIFAADRAEPLQLRLRWYYHVVDFLDSVPRVGAEDELLETPHFNDVSADAVVGRCSVSSYEDYCRLCRENAPVNSTAVPEYEDIDEGAEGAEGADDGADDDDDGNDSDTASAFGDNYASASTRYFVREYYDACLDATALAEFEDPSADPARDIDDGGDSSGSEPRLGRDESDESSDEPSDDGLPADGLPAGKRRKRRRSGDPKRRRAPRPQAAPGDGNAQFPLPDIAIGADLPCRDREKAQVSAFLRGAIEDSSRGAQGAGRCLYISGVPGTGKTATVREILGKLRALSKEGHLPAFEVVMINGMSVADPALVYSALYTAFDGKHAELPPARAHLLLSDRFASADERAARGKRAGASAREQGKCVILVLDEMDVLVSRNDQLLHKVLEWSARPNSRLAIVGIANTMDLPERLLAKSKSRMGDNRLVYAPYTKEQLIQILGTHAKNFHLSFTKTAIQLISTKIASLSGDVRRALHLCTLSEKMAMKLDKKATEVQIQQVTEAIEEIAGGARLSVVSGLARNERLVLISTLLLSRALGAFDVDQASSLKAVLRKCGQVADKHKDLMPWEPEMEELRQAVSILTNNHLLLVERSGTGQDARVVVNMSPDDVIYALKDDKIAAAELHHKSKR